MDFEETAAQVGWTPAVSPEDVARVREKFKQLFTERYPAHPWVEMWKREAAETPPARDPKWTPPSINDDPRYDPRIIWYPLPDGADTTRGPYGAIDAVTLDYGALDVRDCQNCGKSLTGDEIDAGYGICEGCARTEGWIE